MALAAAAGLIASAGSQTYGEADVSVAIFDQADATMGGVPSSGGQPPLVLIIRSEAGGVYHIAAPARGGAYAEPLRIWSDQSGDLSVGQSGRMDATGHDIVRIGTTRMVIISYE